MRLARLLPLLLFAAPAMAGSGDDYARGAAAFAQGDVRAARAALAAALRADPGNGAAHLLQGRVYLALGDGLGAEAELRRALDAGIAAEQVHHLLAHALVLQDSPEPALAEADAAPPRFAAYALRMRGRALTALGRDEEAAAALEQAVRLAPDSVGAWTDLADFRDAGPAAVAAVDRALAVDRRSEPWERPAALLLKGRLVRDQYGLAAALPWFDRALALDRADAAALIERAATLGDLGRARDSLAASRAAIAAGGFDGAAFYLQAVIAARARNYPLARTLIERGGDALDELPGAMLLAGAVELATGNVEQAIERLRRLVAAQPGNVQARRLLAAAQWRVGDWAATADTLTPVADAPDADTYSLALMGRAREALGDRAGAALYLDRAARPRGRGAPELAAALQRAAADPGAADAQLAAGDALAADGRFGEAVGAFTRAANIAFTEPAALRMVEALRRAGRAPAARQVLALFLAQNPRSLAGRLAEADMALGAGRFDRAGDLLDGVQRRVGGSDVAVLVALAWARSNGGALDRGLAAAWAARRLAPASPAGNDMLGWLLWRSGRDRRFGALLLAEAAGQAPDDAAIGAHLALARAPPPGLEIAR